MVNKGRKNTKLNEGCIKIFQLIKLLHEDRAYYRDVVEIFKDEATESSANNLQVILNKNLNALKVFGIKVEKTKNKYELLSNFCELKFSMDDLRSLNILLDSVKNFPDEELANEINDFVQSLYMRMNNEDKNILSSIQQNTNYDFKFYYSDLKEQIKLCEELCKENFLINLIYTKKYEKIKLRCRPQEVIYDYKNVYLKVCSLVQNVTMEISLNDILYIEKMRTKADERETSSTVVYKLKGRLAKNYKLKANETCSVDSNGDKIVVCKNEPHDKLLKRLIRYSYDCEICSPKYLRQQMIDMITESINRYEE